MVRCYFIVKREVFESEEFHCKFTCGHDPQTDSGWEQIYRPSDFIDLDAEISGGFLDKDQAASFSLEKLAAKLTLDQNLGDKYTKNKLSMLYQVLYSGTALFGVVKRKKGQGVNEEEMLKINVN